MIELESTATAARSAVRFCSHCAAHQDDLDPLEALLLRVCPLCGLGILLRSDRTLVTRSGEALLVVTADLRIAAATLPVAALLGDPELVTGLSLLDVGAGALAGPVTALLGGDGSVSEDRVPLAGTLVSVRVGRCGDPPAALVSLRI